MLPQITIALFTDAVGLAFVTALTVELVKDMLPSRQWRPVLCNALTIVFSFGFTVWRLSILPQPSSEDVLVGTANAILAAALATFGYEATVNMAMALQKGNRE